MILSILARRVYNELDAIKLRRFEANSSAFRAQWLSDGIAQTLANIMAHGHIIEVSVVKECTKCDLTRFWLIRRSGSCGLCPAQT